MQDIVEELESLKRKFQRKGYFEILQRACAVTSLSPWPVSIAAMLCCLCLLISWNKASGDHFDLVISLLLISFLIFNVTLACCNEKQKQDELIERLEWLCESIKDIQTDDEKAGPIAEFINFMSSLETKSVGRGPSHSFTTVWRKAQGSVCDEPVLFPTALVSTGDIIGLCVGQTAPCDAVCAADSCTKISAGELLTSITVRECVCVKAKDVDVTNPVLRFTVTRSPLICKLEECLTSADARRALPRFHPSKSLLTKRREKIMLLMLVVIIPVSLGLTILASLVWYFCKPSETLVPVPTNQAERSGSLFPEWSDSVYWFDSFFASPAFVLLPLLPITYPFIWLLLSAVGEAKTLHSGIAKRISVQFRADGRQEPGATLSLRTVESQSSCRYQKQDHDLSWIKLVPHVLCGNKKLLSKNASTFDTLGSLTVLCCVNKEGLLSWIDPSPEKVFFFTKDPGASQSATDSSSTKEGGGSTAWEKEKSVSTSCDSKAERDVHVELLSLSQDTQNSAKLYFDDTDWTKHVSSLKAIGLNILITHPVKNVDRRLLPVAGSDNEEFLLASIADSLQQLYDVGKKQPLPQICRCVLDDHRTKVSCLALEDNVRGPGAARSRTGLHSLARLIGFEDDVSFLYLAQRVVSTYRRACTKRAVRSRKSVSDLKQCDNLSYAHGVVVANMEGQHHLMMSGSGDLVLDVCRYFWDGDAIRPLDDVTRRKISDFFNRADAVGQCVTFSFVPVPVEFAKKESVIFEQSSSNPSDVGIPQGQIFLGMVSLQHQNRLPVFRLVEALDTACIRFVHFTPEDEVRARVFAEKMGIEVGWNCHISLSSNNTERDDEGESLTTRDDSAGMDVEDASQTTSLLARHRQPSSPSTVDDSSFSDYALRTGNRANLPRGVENIIPHIEAVDNVPLLVPLFTDCQNESTRRMIEIMQQYGEVVCCIGSSDSIDNMTVFAQANVSIAIQPILKSSKGAGSRTIERNLSFYSKQYFGSSGALQTSSTIDSLNPADATNLGQGDNLVMETARILNTFPCSISLAGDDSLAVVYNMIKQARHYLFLIQINLVFLMKCQCMFALTLLLCHAAHLPRIFALADLFWLSYVIAPSLSFSLLGSPRDPDVMSWATVKNTKKQRSNPRLLRRSVGNFFVKFAPSSLIVTLGYAIGVVSCCMEMNGSESPTTNASEFFQDSNAMFNLSSDVRCYPQFRVEGLSESDQDALTLQSLQAYFSFKRRVLQQLSVCAICLATCVISTGYVNRWKLLCSACPLGNRLWAITVPVICILQVVYSITVIVTHPEYKQDFRSALAFGPHQTTVWLVLLLWPLPCVLFNEAAKWREIRLWNRAQKRARLEFGTKLGMNSPF